MSTKKKDEHLIGNILIAIILAGMMAFSWMMYEHTKEQDMEHKQDIEELSVKLEQSSEKQVIYQQRLQLIADHATKKILLKGTENAEDAYATAMYHTELKQLLLDPTGLPEVQEGMQLQLWAQSQSKYKSLGVIDYNENLISFDNIDYPIQKLLITLQIEGGEAEPDMDYVYAQGRVR